MKLVHTEYHACEYICTYACTWWNMFYECTHNKQRVLYINKCTHSILLYTHSPEGFRYRIWYIIEWLKVRKLCLWISIRSLSIQLTSKQPSKYHVMYILRRSLSNATPQQIYVHSRVLKILCFAKYFNNIMGLWPITSTMMAELHLNRSEQNKKFSNQG